MEKNNPTEENNRPNRKHNRIKRSNLLFIYLLAALFLVPLLIYGLYTLFPEKGDLPASCPDCTAIRIDNPSLNADQVKIFPQPEHVSNRLSLRTYAYYQGKKKYAAALRIEGTILHVGPPLEAEKDEKLTLHIRLYPLERVELNGQTIWTP